MRSDDSAKQREEEARKKVERLAAACRRVFGVPAARTDAQQIVWEWLEAQCYRHRSTMVADANGALCPLRMAQAEGQRIFLLQIEELVRRASEAGEPQTKPDVIR